MICHCLSLALLVTGNHFPLVYGSLFSLVVGIPASTIFCHKTVSHNCSLMFIVHSVVICGIYVFFYNSHHYFVIVSHWHFDSQETTFLMSIVHIIGSQNYFVIITFIVWVASSALHRCWETLLARVDQGPARRSAVLATEYYFYCVFWRWTPLLFLRH